MASLLSQHGWEEFRQWAPWSTTQPISYVLVLSILVVMQYIFSYRDSTTKHLPLVNAPTSFFGVEAKRSFLQSASRLLSKARSLYPGKPYRITSDLGELVILPPTFADEIRNSPHLSFGKATEKDFHGNIPGFNIVATATRSDNLLQVVARKQLTKSLSRVTQPLSEETAFALSVHLGESHEWQDVAIKEILLSLIARISSRVFLGEELCRNEAWLRITKQYAVQFFMAAANLRLWPRPVRKLVHWFLPECQALRALFSETERLMEPVIKKRQDARRDAIAKGQPVPEYNDALDWAEVEAGGKPYNRATFQLALSSAAIHTTTDLLEQCMLDMAQHPEIIAPLRNEICETLRNDGWNKASLYKMKLLDSAIKESQRMKPSSVVSMRRYVVDDITLSNGLVLKKGSRLNVDSYRMWDSELHPNPDQWDGYRFLNMRSQPGKENFAQLVTTSGDHLGFGHGEHGCPGRFFAANEIKVALCHILMKYDWKLVPGTDIKPVQMGTQINSSPKARLLIRRREKMELDIDSL